MLPRRELWMWQIWNLEQNKTKQTKFKLRIFKNYYFGIEFFDAIHVSAVNLKQIPLHTWLHDVQGHIPSVCMLHFLVWMGSRVHEKHWRTGNLILYYCPKLLHIKVWINILLYSGTRFLNSVTKWLDGLCVLWLSDMYADITSQKHVCMSIGVLAILFPRFECTDW